MACNFSSFLWSGGSAPAALTSLFFEPPEPQIISYLFAYLYLLSFYSFSSDLSLLYASSLLWFSSFHIIGNLTSKFPSIKGKPPKPFSLKLHYLFALRNYFSQKNPQVNGYVQISANLFGRRTNAKCVETSRLFPEGVWAQGSSNSGEFLKYLLIFTYFHSCSSSHSHILTSFHLHIFTSSHPLIFTSSHLYILSASHPPIFTAAHLHICWFHILTSSHLYILSSSHPRIFTSSHLHLHILTSSHLHICWLHILTFHLLLLFSCPLALAFFSFLSWRRRQGAVPTKRHVQIVRNPFAWNEVRSPKIDICDFQFVPRNPFARNEVWSPKTEVKLRFQGSNRNSFVRFFFPLVWPMSL